MSLTDQFIRRKLRQGAYRLGGDDLPNARRDGFGLTQRSGFSAASSRRRGGAVWTPAELSLLLWFEADSGAYSDAGTTQCVNNDLVYQWNDKSSSAANLSQAASVARPTYNTGVLNSLPVMNFTSNVRYMDASHASDQKPVSVAAVVRVGTITSLQYILNGTANNCIGFGFYQSKILFWKQGTTIIAQGSSTLSSNTWYRVFATYDASGNYALYLDGSSDGTGTNNQTFTDTNTRVGNAGGSAMVGEVAALIKTSDAMDTGEITALNAYWGTKYGL